MTNVKRLHILACTLVAILFLSSFSPIFSVRAWEGDSEGTIIIQPSPALSIELLEPQNKSLIRSLPVSFNVKVISNGVPVEGARVLILTSDGVSAQLGPAFTDSDGLTTITGFDSLTIGTKIRWHAEAQKAEYTGAISEKRILAYNPLLAELVSAALEALESQKNGVLEAATIVDNNIPNMPLILLKHSIDFIPLPIPAKGATKTLIEKTVKKAIGLALDQLTPDIKGRTYEIYVKGGFPENIETAKQEIQEIALDDKLLTALKEHEFIQDVLTYFRYISKTGSEYDSQIQDLVDAHNNQKILKEIAFYGASLIVFVATIGVSGPVIIAIGAGEAGTKTVLDIYDEANYQKALVSMSEQQFLSANTFRDSIISAFLYLKDKAKVSQAPLPKVSVSTPSIGKILLNSIDQKGNIDFSIENDFEKPIKARVVISARAVIPELLYKEQTYVIPETTYGYTSEDLDIPGGSQKVIHVESNIKGWLDDVTTKLGGQKISINYVAEVKVFYAEDKIVALKDEWFSASFNLEYIKKVEESWWRTEGSGTAIILYEREHKLYLHVYDQYGRHVGLNHTNSIVEVDIPSATYEDQGNRIIVTLPTNVTIFRYIVDATEAQSTQESYQVTIATIDGNKVASETVHSGSVEQGEMRDHTAEISPDAEKIWVDKPSWSIGLNRLLWKIPIVGNLVKFFDDVVPGFGSLLFILLIVSMGALISITTVRSRKRKP